MERKVFEKAVEIILEYEGGLTTDTGGLTKYGISQRAFPSLDIEKLTKEQAKEIYWRNYWRPIKCGELPYGLAFFLFDSGINMGKRRAIRLLQTAINKFKIKIAVDGIIGAQTLTAVNTLAHTGHTDSLLALFYLERLKFYTRLSKRKQYSRYLLGWINRINDALEKALLEF